MAVTCRWWRIPILAGPLLEANCPLCPHPFFPNPHAPCPIPANTTFIYVQTILTHPLPLDQAHQQLVDAYHILYVGRRGSSMVACQTVVLQSRVRIWHLPSPQLSANLLVGCHLGWHIAAGWPLWGATEEKITNKEPLVHQKHRKKKKYTVCTQNWRWISLEFKKLIRWQFLSLYSSIFFALSWQHVAFPSLWIIIQSFDLGHRVERKDVICGSQ